MCRGRKALSFVLVCLFLASCLWTPSAWAQGAQLAMPVSEMLPDRQVASIGTPPLQENIDITDSDLDMDNWKRLFVLGKKDLDQRMYDDAEQKLLQALKEAKQGTADEHKLILTRLALADVYSGRDDFDQAEKLYDFCLHAGLKTMGEKSLTVAHAQEGLAKCNLAKGRYSLARDYCKEAVKNLRQGQGVRSVDYGMSLVTMGAVLSKDGFNDESDKFFRAGLKILEANPGEKGMERADALRLAALCRQSLGEREAAESLFEQSYQIADANVSLNQPSHLQGTVRFRWEEGSPRSEEIPDVYVPLRYFCTNKVRVAAAVVDLWELIGVLISITNVGDQRVEVGLGPVSLERASDDPLNWHVEKLELVDPNRIDRIRREQDIWRLTANHPWFENMEKTRNVRGLVPPHGHDLFSGPNVFGVYGEWNAATRVIPDRFQLEPSPERLQYQAQVVIDPSLVRRNNSQMPGLKSISLEPFESRTGELFYMNPRCEHLLLKVTIGNTVFEFPFKARKKRIQT